MLDRFAVVSSEVFSEDGWLRFRSSEWQNRELILNVELQGSDVPKQQWQLVCSDVCSARLDGQTSGDIELYDQHPLLWPYAEIQADLYFKGRPQNPQKLLGQLSLATRELVGDWFTPHAFLNSFLWSNAGMTAGWAGGDFALIAFGR